jgi:diacylglycerol kinase
MTATRRLWSDKFRDAARGVRLAVCDGASFRVHFAATVAVVTAGFLCNVSTIEWCVLGLSIGAVLTAETFNSSIEELARAITTEHNKHVGRGLDMAAGAVLLASVAAVIVGLIVFVPRLFSLTS